MNGTLDAHVIPGDGSERCLICGWRSPSASYYVGREGVLNDDGRPEIFPVCSMAHGRVWIERLLSAG